MNIIMKEGYPNIDVAEALGAKWCQHPINSEGRAINAGKPYLAWPDWHDFEARPKVPRPDDAEQYYDGPQYATDWSVTGPLIEKYDFTLIKQVGFTAWEACWYWEDGLDGSSALKRADGDTPLLAVCKLILTMTEDGNEMPTGHSNGR